MPLEVGEREREAVVDGHEPFGDPYAAPAFAQWGQWLHLDRQRVALGRIETQAL